MKASPLQYQERSIRQIEEFRGRCLLAHEMGLGKTLISLWWWQKHPEAHPALVVCPASAKHVWEHEALQNIGVRPLVIEGTKAKALATGVARPEIVIVNYDVLHRWVEPLRRFGFRSLFVDECFPYGVRILTDHGLTSIGKLVEEHIPVKVACWDFSRNALVFRHIIHYTKIPRRTRLVQITHFYGKLVCTENHKIWIEGKGYTNAESLRCGDRMRVVWDHFQKQGQKNTTPLLRDILLCQMEDEPEGNQGKDIHSRKARKRHSISQAFLPDGRGQSCCQKIIRQNEAEQSIETIGSIGESQSDEEKERIPPCMEGKERRQWDNITTRVSIAGTARDSLETQSCYQDQEAEGLWFPTQLQSRSWSRGLEASNRDRWRRTQEPESFVVGHEEAESTCFSRVESVEILEHRSRSRHQQSHPNDPFVYCLTVEEHHNFFADGVLVSNCHYAKSTSAKRTKAVRAVAKGIRHVIAISGTPLLQRPIELFPVLQMLRPSTFPSRWAYAHEYCNPRWTPWGWKYDGACRLPELHDLLKQIVMVRYRKQDVLPELPEKIRRVLPLPLSDEGEYLEAKHSFLAWLGRKNPARLLAAERAEALVKLGYLKQLAARLKLRAAVEWTNEWLLNYPNEKLVLFAVHRKAIEALERRVRAKSVTVDGSVTGRQRKVAVDQFQQDDKTRVFIGNIRAAGVSITLTAASTVAFVELDWVPAVHTQAEDRIHRIGQQQKSWIWYLVAAGTIEEQLCEILERKQRVVTGVLDGSAETDELDVHKQLLDTLAREREEK